MDLVQSFASVYNALRHHSSITNINGVALAMNHIVHISAILRIKIPFAVCELEKTYYHVTHTGEREHALGFFPWRTHKKVCIMTTRQLFEVVKHTCCKRFS